MVAGDEEICHQAAAQRVVMVKYLIVAREIVGEELKYFVSRNCVEFVRLRADCRPTIR